MVDGQENKSSIGGKMSILICYQCARKVELSKIKDGIYLCECGHENYFTRFPSNTDKKDVT